MIIRQTINFAAHLLAGAVLGALVVGMVKARRQANQPEPLEPHAPPAPPPQAFDSGGPAAA